MSYVRSKMINGYGPYYYRVKSVREGDHVRQVHIAYLGKNPPQDEMSAPKAKSSPKRSMEEVKVEPKKNEPPKEVMVSIRKSKGYHGKYDRPSYVAEITGKDEKYGYKRNFQEAKKVDWDDRTSGFKRNWTEHHALKEGRVYEVQEYGERKYVKVKDGKAVEISKEEVNNSL